jgi:hypothetical protein
MVELPLAVHSMVQDWPMNLMDLQLWKKVSLRVP